MANPMRNENNQALDFLVSYRNIHENKKVNTFSEIQGHNISISYTTMETQNESSSPINQVVIKNIDRAVNSSEIGYEDDLNVLGPNFSYIINLPTLFPNLDWNFGLDFPHEDLNNSTTLLQNESRLFSFDESSTFDISAEIENLAKPKLNKLLAQMAPDNPVWLENLLSAQEKTITEENDLIRIWQNLRKSKLKTQGGIHILSEEEAALIIGGQKFWNWLVQKSITS